MAGGLSSAFGAVGGLTGLVSVLGILGGSIDEGFDRLVGVVSPLEGVVSPLVAFPEMAVGCVDAAG